MTVRPLLIAAAAWAAAAVSGAPLALPATGESVTIFLPPEAAEFADVRVFEVDASGNELGRVGCALEEHALNRLECGVSRAVRFTPAAGQGVRYYRFEADRGTGGNWRADSGIFPAGNFEEDGWWFGAMNPVLSFRDAAGRGGGRALEVDLISGNTGEPVVAGSRPAELLQLADPEIFPVLMRGFVRLEAGDGAGAVLRMRCFDADNRYAGDYGNMSIVGGAPGEWHETRLLLTRPLEPDAVALEVFLVNLAPRDGVRFLVDDIQFLPVERVAPAIEFIAPEEVVYAGEELRFTVRAAGAGVVPVWEETLAVRVGGREESLPVWIAGLGPAVIDGAEFAVELRNAAGETLLAERAMAAGGAAEVAVRPEAGEYRVILTLTAPDGTVLTRALECPVLEDPFAG